MVLCFREPPGRFLLLLFTHFSSSCCCCSSLHFHATLPCHRHSTLASQACEALHQLWALPRLLLIVFAFSSTASATVLSGNFFTHRCFLLLASSPTFFCVYQGLPGSWQSFLEVFRASYWSSKHRPGPSVCLIHSNPQSSYSEKFIFKFYYILSWITCDKKFSLYAAYLLQTLFACS